MSNKLNNAINVATVVIVLLAVIFSAFALLVPEAQTAGSALNDTGRCEAAGGTYCNNMTTPFCYTDTNCNVTQAYTQVPLGNLFSGTGIVFVIVMAALLILVIRSFMPGKK